MKKPAWSGIFRFRIVHICLLFLLLAVAFFISCKQQIPPKDAEKYLRAFDNELLSMFNAFQGTKSFRIFKAILKSEDAPIPFISNKAALPGKIPQFNFDIYRGIYEYDTITNRFFYKAISDSIILCYPVKDYDGVIARLVISNYSEEESSSSLMIPSYIQASMYVGNRQIALLNFDAKIEHKLPVEASLNIIFEDFLITAELSSKLRRNGAKARVEVFFSKDDKHHISSYIESRLGFTETGSFYLKALNAEVLAFPLMVKAEVDNYSINPKTKDFIKEFNRHSRIEVFRLSNKNRIGEIKLITRESSDKLDYAFYYSDDTYIFLDELLITVNKLMNIKK